jgi:CIC family chloride channel protein
LRRWWRFSPRSSWPGAGTLYAVHLSGILTAADYALLVAMGLLAGLCGPLLMWLMDVQPRAFPAPQAFAAVAAGAGRCDRRAAVSSHAEGVGEWLQRGSGFLLAPPLLSVIAGVFICKLLAVLASSGSGAPGGVFTPTLFVGMATGMLFAQLFALWLPGSETAILLGLAGMATLLAATTHAPIMSALMVCEMTGQYFLLPGLLVACVVASVLSRTLRHDSIYGQHATEGREIDVLR